MRAGSKQTSVSSLQLDPKVGWEAPRKKRTARTDGGIFPRRAAPESFVMYAGWISNMSLYKQYYCISDSHYYTGHCTEVFIVRR